MGSGKLLLPWLRSYFFVLRMPFLMKNVNNPERGNAAGQRVQHELILQSDTRMLVLAVSMLGFLRRPH